MAMLTIIESRGLVKHPRDDTYLPLLDVVTTQNKTLSATSRQSSALGTSTKFITLVSSAAVYFRDGASPTATTATSIYLPAGVYFTKEATAGDVVAVITA